MTCENSLSWQRTVANLVTFRWMLLATFALWAIFPAPAPAAPADALSAYENARQTMLAAIEASGGLEAIESIRTLDLHWSGKIHWDQRLSRSPKPPYDVTPEGRQYIFDRDRDWKFRSYSVQYPGLQPVKYVGFLRKDEAFFVGTEGFEEYWVILGDGFGLKDSFPIESYFPAGLFRLAIQRRATLRWHKKEQINSRAHDVISFADSDGSLHTLFIDSRSHLLIKMEGVGPNAVAGDALIEVFFGDYQNIAGLVLPTTYKRYVAGQLVNEYSASYKINEPIDESLFELPEEYVEQPLDRLPNGPEIREIAGGVYLAKVNANSYMGFIEFESFILGIWAPFTPPLSSIGINLIKDILPDKPIKYVGTTTHHWWDASGGVAAFVDIGATIISNPANVDLLTTYASAQRTLLGIAPSVRPEQLSIEVVEHERTISDRDRTLKIYALAETPNSMGGLMYYLPSEGVLFSAAFFEATFHDGQRSATNRTVHLARAAKELGLEVTTVVSLNGGEGTWEHVVSSLKLRQAWDERPK